MKRFILFAILVLIALSPLAYTQEIGGVYGVFSPAKIGAKKLPTWLSSEWSPIFNGVNGYALATLTATIGDNFTYMWWMRRYSSPTTFNWFHGLSGVAFLTQSDGSCRIQTASNLSFLLDVGAVPVWTWTHLAFTKVGNTHYLYIDGALRTLNSTVASSPFSIATNSKLSLGIGYNNDYAANCSLSELSIWNRALTQPEILKYKDKRLKGSENGIVALYHLNDNSSTMVDSVAGKNAIATNTFWTKRNGFQPPDVRSERWALSLDGVDDYASGSAEGFPATQTARTMMGWFFDKTPAGAASYIFTYGPSAPIGIFWGSPTPNTIGVYYGSGYYNHEWARSVGWKHIALTLPTGGTGGSFTIYVDGNPMTATRTYLAGAPSAVVDIGTGTLYFGQHPNGTYKFSGKIADFSVWNKALNQSEIQQYMYTQLTGNETGLIRYFKVREGTGTTLDNAASTVYDMTLYNSPTWTGRDIP